MNGKGGKSVSSATAVNTAPTSNKKNSKKKSVENKTRSSGKEEFDSKSAASVGVAPPGFSQQTTSVLPPKTGFSQKQQRLLRHRALYAFRFLVGKAVEVQLVDGSRYIGILDCIDPDDFSIVLKNTQCTKESSETFESGSTVIFKRRQLVSMSADGVADYREGTVGSGPAAALSGFRTDTEISGRQHDHLYGRELQTASSWLDPQLDSGGLEDQPRRRSSSKSSAWNQFDANEKLFGVVSSFDENLYTTKLDKSKMSNEKAREAERLAKEIEREATGNFHLQEERGQVVLARDDLDEETRYSSVDRKLPEAKERRSSLTPGTGAYIPPALRNASASAAENVRKVVSPTSTTSSVESVSGQPASTVPSGSQPRKPISFSEAVTGRSATTIAKPAASDNITKEKASGTTTKTAISPKKEKIQSPKPMRTPATITRVTSPKTTDSSPETKEAKHTRTLAPSPNKTVTDPKLPAKETKPSQEPTSDTVGDAPKKGLNPKAKEFKLSASAVSFTPKFAATAQPVATSSPYRQGNSGPYGHMPPPVPGMAMGYHQPMPEEWMYEGGMMVEEGEYPPHGGVSYMGYGVPMMPNPAMHMPQQPMYPMMHQNSRMHMGGSHPRGIHNSYGGGAYMPPQQQPQHQYTPRSPYYGSGMPYPVTQPPLPPTPVDEEPIHASGDAGEDGSLRATTSEVEQPKNE